MNRVKETLYSKFWITDNILFFIYKPIIFLDYTTAQHIVKERLLFQQERAYAILCDTRGILNSEKSARDYLANEGSTLTKAVGVVDNRHIAKVMLRFYLIKNKPITPTALFETNSEAIAFLTPYI